MNRLITIIGLIALAVFMFKYGTNEKVQRLVVITAIVGLSIYTAIVVVSELLR
ncbi:hypothetical protein L3Q72_07440 [Vibrio sp. JC009]|uniref:hypothetical protein n=1 Tax=Vibrio sp. JC009 TaxID=2912314 RepID=UPI0023B200C3|nr:hypothetical protein [Vibrio sp. JC009]WED23215.1 hypothetical protein L3Q72_07440 [Vibrio sp. JC009]